MPGVKALKYRAVLAIDRHQPRHRLGRQFHDQRPGHHQRLFVRQCDRASTLEGGPSASQSRTSNNCRHYHIKLLGLALTTGSAEAGGFKGGYQGYYKVHGMAFKGGYYYRGRHHCHWGHRCWCPTYKRYKLMEASWLALAKEQDWLDGVTSPTKIAS